MTKLEMLGVIWDMAKRIIKDLLTFKKLDKAPNFDLRTREQIIAMGRSITDAKTIAPAYLKMPMLAALLWVLKEKIKTPNGGELVSNDPGDYMQMAADTLVVAGQKDELATSVAALNLAMKLVENSQKQAAIAAQKKAEEDAKKAQEEGAALPPPTVDNDPNAAPQPEQMGKLIHMGAEPVTEAPKE